MRMVKLIPLEKAIIFRVLYHGAKVNQDVWQFKSLFYRSIQSWPPALVVGSKFDDTFWQTDAKADKILVQGQIYNRFTIDRGEINRGRSVEGGVS
jgi:hypothetical protein